MATFTHHEPCSKARERPLPYLFHPLEIAFSGYSGSGKTTLIVKMIEKLSSQYSVGYVKHDAHHFKMDREGKDTSKAWKNGAAKVYIADVEHSALLSSGAEDGILQRLQMVDCDCVLVEGYKQAPIDKILVLDEDETIVEAVSKGEIDRVAACVGQKRISCHPALHVPYFHRDDIAGIFTFLKDRIERQAGAAPLFGLVLAGGYSTRMQSDKALLSYHGKPQAERCYELLSDVCEQTFLSSRHGQHDHGCLQHLPKLYDRFADFGPLGGILTAMTRYPQAGWLVLACDLPLIDSGALQDLIGERNPLKMATAFLSSEDGLPEPLCAIYEPKFRIRLLEWLGLGHYCPRKILIHSKIHKIALRNKEALKNVNCREEYAFIKTDHN